MIHIRKMSKHGDKFDVTVKFRCVASESILLQKGRPIVRLEKHGNVEALEAASDAFPPLIVLIPILILIFYN